MEYTGDKSTGSKGLGQTLLDPGGFIWRESAPGAPDFIDAAEKQAESGRINTPFANWNGKNLEFSGGLGTGVENLMNQIGNQGALPTGQQARDQAITSAYDQAKSRLDPMMAGREQSLRAQLANQGLDPGSEAADKAMGQFGRDRNDAYSSAMANAIGQGTLAGNAIFQQGLAEQNQPYGQLGKLAGLLQGNVGPETKYLDAANMKYLGDLQGYSIQQGGKNSQMGGLGELGGSIGGALISSSDERLKKNIERSQLEAIPGVPFASWEWVDGPPGRYIGVIAQDLERVAPEFVHTGPNGFKLVDYGFLEMSHG